MKGTKTVSVLVLVGAGSRYETKNINGISHFLEHMAFKGTTKRPNKVAIAQELDEIGAHYNAFTHIEYTGYWIKADRTHAELAFDILSDMYIHSTLPAEEIEKERGVIIGEIDMYEDMPMYKVSQVFNELLYGDQPIGWDVAGTKEAVKSISRDDFSRYRETYYRAPNTLIVVSGNISNAKARNLFKKYFRDVPSGKTSKPPPAKEKQRGSKVHVYTKKTDQAHLILGVRAFGLHDRRRWALGLLSIILGGTMSSRLFIKIREELGLGYYIHSESPLFTDYGTFEVGAGVDVKRLDVAIDAIIEELSRIKKDGIEKEELQKARENVRGSSLISLEQSDKVANYFGKQELLARTILTPEQQFRMLEKVTPADVKKVAQDIFRDDRLNLAVVGPVKDEVLLKKRLTFS
jgi:predicted Zn-dependent peptidase